MEKALKVLDDWFLHVYVYSNFVINNIPDLWLWWKFTFGTPYVYGLFYSTRLLFWSDLIQFFWMEAPQTGTVTHNLKYRSHIWRHIWSIEKGGYLAGWSGVSLRTGALLHLQSPLISCRMGHCNVHLDIGKAILERLRLNPNIQITKSVKWQIGA